MLYSVSGFIGSGKDTVTTYLVEHRGFEKMSFSAKLKDAVACIFGWDRALLEGDTEESREWRDAPDMWWTNNLNTGEIVTPRWVLQHIGTDVMRNNFDSSIWLLAFQAEYEKRKDSRIVVSDARFLNELCLIDSLGGKTLGVYRKLPAWLGKYYAYMEKELASFQGNNVDIATHKNWLSDVTRKWLKQERVDCHESEIMHTIWNRYTGVIDNSGSLADTFRQVDACLLL
jgi:hypothetical protein